MNTNEQQKLDGIDRFSQVKKRMVDEGKFTPQPNDPSSEVRKNDNLVADQQSAQRELHQAAQKHPDFLDNGINSHPGMTSQGVESSNLSVKSQSMNQETNRAGGERLSAKIKASQGPTVARNIAEGNIHPPERTKELSKSLSGELAMHKERRAQEALPPVPI